MPDVGSAVGGAISLIGSSGDDSDEYYEAAGDASLAQLELARKQDKRAEEMWQIWQDTFLPGYEAAADQYQDVLPLYTAGIEQYFDAETADRARYEDFYKPWEDKYADALWNMVEGEPDYERALARTRAEYDRQGAVAREQWERDMERRGLSPKSWGINSLDNSILQAGQTTAGLNRAVDTEIDRNREDQRFGLSSMGNLTARGLNYSTMNNPGMPAAPNQISATGALTAGANASGQMGQAASNLANVGGAYADASKQAGTFGGYIGEKINDAWDAWGTPSTGGISSKPYGDGYDFGFA